MKVTLRNILRCVYSTGLMVLLLGGLVPQKEAAAQRAEGMSHQISYTQLQDKFYKAEINDKISLQLHETSLEVALREISNSAGLRLSYRGDIIADKKVTLLDQDISVSQALEQALRGTHLDYRISQNGYLIISEMESAVPHQEVVTGRVTDGSTGDILPGVNVVIKGTLDGAATDSEGEFQLIVPSLQDTLIVTYIGYQQLEVPISGQQRLEIELLPASIMGEELVVVGYGEQRAISVVGSQSFIDDPQELNISSGSLTNSLAGRLSGVVGVQRSGLPGADASDIWIRGISTFGSSGPLVLVDGIERPMNSLNPDDIQSLTILKDASATAVYGTRGANGVILINTKEGREGSPSISVNFYQGVTQLTKVPEMADGLTYMQLANEARQTRGQNPIYSDEYIQNTINGVNPLLYPDVDWMSTIFNDFGQNRHLNANVSGGSQLVKYYVSLSYYNETGLLVNNKETTYSTNSDYDKYNMQSNVTLNITPTTRAKLGVGGYLEERQYPNPDGGGVGGIFSQAMDASPVSYPVIYPGGLVPGRNPNGGERNPYIDATDRGYSNQFNAQLFSNLELTQDLDFLAEGLFVRGLFGFDTYNSNTINRGKRPDSYYIDPNNPFDVDGSYNYALTFEGNNSLGYNRGNSGNRSLYLQTSLHYDNQIALRHRVTGLLVYSQSDYISEFANNLTESLPYREQSLALRGTYSYDERYFFEANFGYSGSENFAPENRWGFFPSAGIGWVISNEDFFQPLRNTINFLKLRYSDGFVGASGSGGRRFAYLTLVGGASGYTYGIDRGSGRGGLQISDYGVDVRWAESRIQDLGIEIRTFQDRLSLTFDLFKERREGIFLGRASVPAFVGLVNNPVGNVGIVENKGFDGQLRFNGQIGQQVNFGFQGQFTYNRDTIIDNDQPTQPYPWMERRGNNILAGYGYVAEGLFESQEEIDNHARQFGTVLPGDIKYKDLNGDGVIDAYDQKKISRGDVPYLTLGAGLSFGYKAFDLSAFFQAQFGAERYIGGSSIHPFEGGGGRGNLFAIATDRWTEENPNPDAFYPRLAYGDAENVNNFEYSSYWIHSMDFIRLQELELGYRLPVSVTGSNRVFNNARLYFRGRNLLTFSDFDLWDPELNTANGTSYPNTRVFAIGIDIQF